MSRPEPELDRQAVDLFRDLDGVDDVGDSCSGISGTYGRRAERYDTSMAVGEEMFDHMGAAAGRTGMTGCPTCAMRMEHGTGYEVRPRANSRRRRWSSEASGLRPVSVPVEPEFEPFDRVTPWTPVAVDDPTVPVRRPPPAALVGVAALLTPRRLAEPLAVAVERRGRHAAVSCHTVTRFRTGKSC